MTEEDELKRNGLVRINRIFQIDDVRLIIDALEYHYGTFEETRLSLARLLDVLREISKNG